MVDSRMKGMRAELVVRRVLVEHTKLNWQRVPHSGALNPKHLLKGDLYIPGKDNVYCIEVKHYKEPQITHALIVGKKSELVEWWEQTIREAKQINKKPLLLFKHDRSKVFAAFLGSPSADYPYIIVNRDGHEFIVSSLEDFLKHENPQFIV